MPKRTTPITVFFDPEDDKAIFQITCDLDGRTLTTGPGTLKFHTLIAQHGAGEFTTLYVPLALKGSFKPPAGGIVRTA